MSSMNIRPIRLPRPVFLKPREIRTATTISHMRELEKLLSASAMASREDVAVTCDSATTTIAIIAMTPIGITLRMMARMVVRKIARSAQALAVSPAGAGTSSRIASTTVAISAGFSLNGTASSK